MVSSDFAKPPFSVHLRPRATHLRPPCRRRRPCLSPLYQYIRKDLIDCISDTYQKRDPTK